ncbi:hypothetical protein [Bacillus weihaiensis]|uniref:hypothetical protein n=1 Tax=Bacillus weihaiensis TaxID=1547283 RepID=UPI002355DB76|nr:hypothetical protein [Bacillus weihaiensis]
MDCIICEKRIVNENNQLQNKVRQFLKTNKQLDLKHQWIKEWKICYGCSEQYTNEMLELDAVVIIEKMKLKRKENQKKKQKGPSQSFREDYIRKYIEYATDKSEEKGRYTLYQPPLKNRQQYDKAYIEYVERRESLAVMIVRDLVKTIDTRGYWVDVRHLEEHFLTDFDRDFSFIIVELFQRVLKPDYPKKMIEETDADYKNRIAYITWKTANADIHSQRTRGIKGDVYLILPRLKNEHEDMYDKHFIVWDSRRLVFRRVRIGKEYVNIIKPPKWSYEIVATEKINHQQLRYIEKNMQKIVRKTHKERNFTLSIFRPQQR